MCWQSPRRQRIFSPPLKGKIVRPKSIRNRKSTCCLEIEKIWTDKCDLLEGKLASTRNDPMLSSRTIAGTEGSSLAPPALALTNHNRQPTATQKCRADEDGNSSNNRDGGRGLRARLTRRAPPPASCPSPPRRKRPPRPPPPPRACRQRLPPRRRPKALSGREKTARQHSATKKKKKGHRPGRIQPQAQTRASGQTIHTWNRVDQFCAWNTLSAFRSPYVAHHPSNVHLSGAQRRVLTKAQTSVLSRVMHIMGPSNASRAAPTFFLVSVSTSTSPWNVLKTTLLPALRVPPSPCRQCEKNKEQR